MDELWMERCFELALLAKGQTSPNPLVGAIVVQDGEVVGEGYHHKAGEPHAEVFALRQAGRRAQGGILYVNLEPCSHYGRTPPCTERIIAAGIGRVVVAMVDPNPKVAGQGITRLRQAGIQVEVGIKEREALALNEVFVKYITTKRPFVLWKVASTLDGKVATSTGDARWVTGGEARAAVHLTRGFVDGIVVGSNTVLQDDPELTARPLAEGLSQPLRILLDSRARISPQAKVMSSQGGMVLWVVGSTAQPSTVPDGVKLVRSPKERIDVDWLLEYLGEQRVSWIMLEGGPQLATSFWQSQAIDKVQWYIAPKLVGGDGRGALNALELQLMSQAFTLKDTSMRTVGDNWCLEGYPVWD